MAEYIEGKRAVLEAFKTNVPATCLYVAEGSHGDKNVSELVKRAHKMGLSVKQVKRDQLDKRSERGSHQGVMLETKPFEYCSAQALINGALAPCGAEQRQCAHRGARPYYGCGQSWGHRAFC